MRRIVIAVSFACGIASAGSTSAQTPLEGPLASPEAKASTAKPAKPKSPHHKPVRVAHHPPATAAYGSPDAGTSPDPRPNIREVNPGAPADPLSFGMKWNGSNDSARDTRVQNYGGDATGSGAEMGLKLHF